MIGLTAGGYFIGRGAARFKSDARTVTVKGLVEKEVKADEAIWTLSLRRASDDIKEAHGKISADRDAVLAFLQKRGFKDNEIARQPTRTIDKLAREFGQPQTNERFRYLVTTAVVVRAPNVDLVQKSLGETEELLRGGVILDGEREGGAANPRYVFSKFNDFVRNARRRDQKTRAQSSSTSRRPGAASANLSANQGAIQISADGSRGRHIQPDEHADEKNPRRQHF